MTLAKIMRTYKTNIHTSVRLVTEVNDETEATSVLVHNTLSSRFLLEISETMDKEVVSSHDH